MPIEKIKQKTGCKKLINLGYFGMNAYAKSKTNAQVDASTECDLVVSGKPIKPLQFKEFGAVINANGELSFGIADGAYSFCIGLPPQYYNGEKYCTNTFVAKNGCSHIGFKADGTILWAIALKDSPETNDAVNTELLKHGCIHILRFDGSWSSQAIMNDKIYKPSQERIVQSLLLAYERNPTKKEDDTLNIIQPNYKWAYGATLRKKTTHIVLHHVGVVGNFTPEQIHAEHLRKGWRGIGYNFYVRKDGSIYRGREENAAGGHTLNYNEVSIGICFEGNFETETMSDAQLNAGRKLIEYLKPKYPDAKIVRHRDLNATACPGKNFPFVAMINAPKAKSYIYRVQVGAYTVRKNAELIVKDLETKGYKPYIVTEEVKA